MYSVQCVTSIDDSSLKLDDNNIDGQQHSLPGWPDGVMTSSGSNVSEWQIYVGNAPSHVTRHHESWQGYRGCVTRLFIGDYQFELGKAAIGLTGVTIGCSSGAKCLLNNNNNTVNSILTIASHNTPGVDEKLAATIGNSDTETRQDAIVDSFELVEDGRREALPQTAGSEDIQQHTASRQHAQHSPITRQDIELTALIGICVFTTILVTCILLAAVSCTWKRLTRQSKTVIQTDNNRIH